MTFLDRELSRIRTAMPGASPERRRELYIALQALSWAGDPTYFRPPYDVIVDPLPGRASDPCRPHHGACGCHHHGSR